MSTTIDIQSKSNQKTVSHLVADNILTRTEFRKRIVYQQSLPAQLIDEFWNHPDQLIDRGTPLKKGRRTTIVSFESADNVWVLKRYNLRNPFHTLRHLLLTSRARKSWYWGNLLVQQKIRTPKPQAFLEYKWGLLKTRSYLLTPLIQGQSLSKTLFQKSSTTEQLQNLARQFSELWYQLSRLQISHGDSKTSNFLVSDQDQLWITDLDAMQQHHSRFFFEQSRAKDWQRLLDDFQNHPEIRDHFQTAYRQICEH